VRAISRILRLLDQISPVCRHEGSSAIPHLSLPSRPDRAWREAIKHFERPVLHRSIRQLLNTLLPYFALLAGMVLLLDVSYWLSLLLAVPAAGFAIRTFIICHDCGHGSFFRSRTANRWVGFVTGVLTFTPAQAWARQHKKHHATSGNLDKRGTGDIWTMTVQEYLDASWWQRLQYRLYRHPLVMFGIGPAYMFFVLHRFWRRGDDARARWDVVLTNLALLAIVTAASLTIGLKAYLMVQLPVMLISGTAGVWLFYVQHQFEGTYWERHEGWDYYRQAVEGSSFYRLPRVLQWFTGNIGFHHVHHLSSKIPNYHLEACHRSNPLFHSIRPVTLWSSLKSLGYRLWDEERQRLVGFDAVPAYQKARVTARR